MKKKALDEKRRVGDNQKVSGRMRFPERVRKAGYKSVGDFFLKNGAKTHKAMAVMLGLATHGGIGHQYRKWLEEKLQGKGVVQ